MLGKPWARRGLVIGVIAVLTLLAGSALAVKLVSRHYMSKVERLPDPFVSIPPSSRPSPTEGGMTVLLIGLDTGSKDANARADTLMVARIARDRRHAYVISIPRDSWVEVPGHGTRKINSSYALGGPSLAVRTVEKLTRLRMDHVAVIGWDGFRELTDAVGGVEITIPEDSYDPSQGVSFSKGTHRLNGERALLYVRQRYGLPRGDLDRMQRQQNFLRALLSQLVDRQTLTDPTKLNALLTAVAGSIKVDNHLSENDLWWLATDAPKLRESVRFLNAPVDKLMRTPDPAGTEQSIVVLNMLANETLWQAVGADKVEEYLATYGADELGATPR